MGAHLNYAMIIYHLVLLKDELHRIRNLKYQELIKELQSFQVEPHSDSDHLPDHHELANKLKISQAKMYSLLKGLYKEFIEGLSMTPLRINNYVHQIHIHYPYDERKEMSKEREKEASDEAALIQMILPITPRVGDEIDIPFIEHAEKRFRGYVHSVQHVILGTTQEIYIEVHPLHDYYYKWVKMKNNYEYWENWKANR